MVYFRLNTKITVQSGKMETEKISILENRHARGSFRKTIP